MHPLHAALVALPLALLSGPQEPAPAAEDPKAAAASRAAVPDEVTGGAPEAAGRGDGQD